ncbi:hypothetical protein PARPLA_00581 [Rhodobacteraceae bacterium THAF1]|uniref:hypothetical protein n=1 Tax=Palleronia sp. THAF1 TaxID=2587842 RepID=UPI000F40D034|nr:hypothetical protein [Palleronia sp. THAF1]QFU09856.1 hypothetical protein FIU81_14355 [Palleronia sp. THAF1]VDC17241.1 hypothetical protein PARPLA_00581 [Rhodobacteraceae bacterium THAF1]
MVSQTLSLLGMMAIAVLIVVIYRAAIAETGGMPWLRVAGVLVFAALCFWGAGRVKGKG